MANSKRKCKNCGERVRDYIIVNNSAYCNFEAAVSYANKNKAIGKKIIQKAQKKKDLKRIKELMTRPKWYMKLQALVNQWIVHVRDKDKPCYTCGTVNPNIKYDAGHRHHAGRGGGDRRRFLEENIHKQCSVVCNQHGGGMPVEYDAALNEEYGQGFSNKLSCVSNYPELKEQFPTWQDIEVQIKKYRSLLRAEGLTPTR